MNPGLMIFLKPKICCTYLSCLDIDADELLQAIICGQRGHFNFPNVNLPFLIINKPYAPWYSVSISQLIHYIPACSIFTADLCIFKEPNACTQTHYHMHSKSIKTSFSHAFYSYSECT